MAKARMLFKVGAALLLLWARPTGITAVEGMECTTIGAHRGKGQAVPLESLLEEIEDFDGRWVTTEGVFSVEPEGNRLCLGRQGEDRSDLAQSCLELGFAWDRLGGDERTVTKFLEQWYQKRARVRGRVYSEGGLYFGVAKIYRGGLYNVTYLELLEAGSERLYCLGALEDMPPPESPNEYLGGRREELIRCGLHDEDEEGLRVCLDFERPWVWTEAKEGWTRTEYGGEEPDVAEFLRTIKYLIPLGEGRFAAVLVDHLVIGELVGDLIIWTGKEFLSIAENATYDMFPSHGRLYFAEADEDEHGTVLRSRVYWAGGDGQRHLISTLSGGEVVSISGSDRTVTLDLEEDGHRRTVEVSLPADAP